MHLEHASGDEVELQHGRTDIRTKKELAAVDHLPVANARARMTGCTDSDDDASPEPAPVDPAPLNGPQIANLRPKPEGVGTGAGEGAPRQDTGSAWVTRSADCPEAPAQAHPLDPNANLGDGANGRLSETERVEILHAALRDMIRSDRSDFPNLTSLVERIVREHTERAWDEAIHHVEPHLSGPIKRAAMQDNPYRAARQEQNR